VTPRIPLRLPNQRREYGKKVIVEVKVRRRRSLELSFRG